MSANLSSNIKIVPVKAYTTAATTNLFSTPVNMAGYEGVLFLSSFGTAGASNTIKVQQSTSSASGTAAFADLTGSSVSLGGSSDEHQWVEVHRPLEKWVRIQFMRGSSTTIEKAYALQYGPRNAAVDNTTAGTIAGELHASPAEGTA